MQEIGIYQAKQRLSSLVAQASGGKSFLITVRGEAKAMLLPLVALEKDVKGDHHENRANSD